MIFLYFLLVFGASGEELSFTKAEMKRGVEYFFSVGVKLRLKDNVKEAFPYILRASDLGHAEAHVFLAEYYIEGFAGVPRDGKKAFDLLTRGEKAGDPLAFFFLGEMYRAGFHVDVDQKKALELYKKAAKHPKLFDPSELNFIKKLIKSLNDTTQKLKAVKAKAQKGDKEFQYRLAMLYLDGQASLIGDKDEDALDWMERSSSKGYELAQLEMGDFYSMGLFVKKDLNKAFAFYEKAGEQGNGLALISMLIMYINGDKEFAGEIGDIGNEISELVRAVDESGNSDALYDLALMYLNEGGFFKQNLGFEKNVRIALYYLEKAVKTGNHKLAKAKIIEVENKLYESQKDDIKLSGLTCRETFKNPRPGSVRIFGNNAKSKVLN